MWKCPIGVLRLCAVTVAALVVAAPATAAAPPLNDNRAAAEPIPAFSGIKEVDCASAGAGQPAQVARGNV